MQLGLLIDSSYGQSISEKELINLPVGLIGASPHLLVVDICTGLAGTQEFPPLLVGYIDMWILCTVKNETSALSLVNKYPFSSSHESPTV